MKTMREFLQGKILLLEEPGRLKIVSMRELWDGFCPDLLFEKYGVESVR